MRITTMKTALTALFISIATLVLGQNVINLAGWNNDRLFNPALVGDEFDHISVDHFSLFPKFSGSPNLTLANLENSLGKSAGIGLMASSYNIGHSNTHSILIRSSRVIKLKQGRVRLGAAVGLERQHAAKQQTYFQGGFSYHTEKLTLGAALIDQFKSIYNSDAYFNYPRGRMISTFLHYRIELNDAWSITPRARVTIIENTPTQSQLRALVHFKKIVQLGIGSRMYGSLNSEKSIEGFIAVQATRRILLGYTTTYHRVSSFPQSTHSLNLTVNIEKE